MPAKQQAPVPEVRFQNPRLTALGIELMSLAKLRRNVSALRLGQAQRVEFYQLMWVQSGSGMHTVDFVEWPLAAGSLVFVRPGQVQQWHALESFEAQLILIDPSALPQAADPNFSCALNQCGFDDWASCLSFDARAALEIDTAFSQLQRDFAGFAGQGLDIALIRYGLMALLIRLARLQGLQQIVVASAGRVAIYRMFAQVLETHFAREHSLHYYARRLGYSESTLSRACMAAEGRSAKTVISRRIVLEAKRLLAHSALPVVSVAHQLGFSEPTNFVKFFRRHTELTPQAFRQRMAPSASSD